MRILLAESESPLRTLLHECLGSGGEATVSACAGTLEALLAGLDEALPDVVVLGNFAEPGEELRALREIRSLLGELPVVLFAKDYGPTSAAVGEGRRLGGVSRVGWPLRVTNVAELREAVEGALVDHVFRVAAPPEPEPAPEEGLAEPLDPEAIEFVRSLVCRVAGIRLGTERDFIVQVRLTPLAWSHGFPSAKELVEAMRGKGGGALRREAVEAIVDTGTRFFKHPPAFDFVREVALPQLMAQNMKSKRLDAWAMACSAGQEAYSLAMVFDETERLARWDVHLVASDLSARAIDRAQRGAFGRLEVARGLPVQLLARHFAWDGTHWAVQPTLREQIEFRRINPVADWPELPPMDLVFLREVLMYLEPERRSPLIERLAQALRPGGFLVIGPQESIDSPAFEPVVGAGAVGYRRR